MLGCPFALCLALCHGYGPPFAVAKSMSDLGLSYPAAFSDIYLITVAQIALDERLGRHSRFIAVYARLRLEGSFREHGEAACPNGH
jgi:hypothetical protein